MIDIKILNEFLSSFCQWLFSALKLVVLKGAMSRFVHLEKFSLNFSRFLFEICFNLLLP